MKYYDNMIQLLEDKIKDMKGQIDMIESEIELKKHLIEVYRSKAQEAAALEASSKLASKKSSKKPRLGNFRHQS